MLRDDALAGRHILVTGGGSGLGLAIARRFVELGARVGLIGRSRERLEEAARTIGGAVATHPADVRDAAALEAAIASIEDAAGPLDGLVNNAAGNFLAATEDLSPNAFDAVVRIVLYGSFHATVALGRRWIERGTHGTVLSILTPYAWTGSAFVVPSAAAKAGVLAMTRSLAVEWAAYGIRLNAIAPGPFPTEGAMRRLFPTPELEERARARVPLGRFGRPEELAELAAFLMCDAAPYITGDCVTIDGGRWIGGAGEFNELTRMPRDELKRMFDAFRPR